MKVTTIPSPVLKISCGQFYTYFRTINDQIYACGLNNSNMVSAATQNDIMTPTLINYTDIKTIKAGDFFVLLERYDNTVLKIGTGGDFSVPLSVLNHVYSAEFSGTTVVQLLDPIKLFKHHYSNTQMKMVCGSSKAIFYLVSK
jgi:alpha-tubulin suppressor-like RCC1 family protein